MTITMMMMGRVMMKRVATRTMGSVMTGTTTGRAMADKYVPPLFYCFKKKFIPPLVPTTITTGDNNDQVRPPHPLFLKFKFTDPTPSAHHHRNVNRHHHHHHHHNS